MTADPRLGDGDGGFASIPIRTCEVCGVEGVMVNVEAFGQADVLCPTHAAHMRKLIEMLRGWCDRPDCKFCEARG